MLFDFRANRIVLIASLALAALLLALFVRQSAPIEQILLLFAFFGLFITFNLRHMSLRAMRQLEYRFMVQLNAEAYQKAYAQMLERGAKYNPRWHLTKYQRTILGTLLTGHASAAAKLRHQQNEKFKDLIEDDPYFQYLNQVTLTLEALLYGSKVDMTKAFHKEKEVLKKLNPKYQQQIEQNPHSFSNVFKLLETNNQTLEHDSLKDTMEAWTPFMRVIGLAYLTRHDERFASDFEAIRQNMLKDYTINPL